MKSLKPTNPLGLRASADSGHQDSALPLRPGHTHTPYCYEHSFNSAIEYDLQIKKKSGRYVDVIDVLDLGDGDFRLHYQLRNNDPEVQALRAGQTVFDVFELSLIDRLTQQLWQARSVSLPLPTVKVPVEGTNDSATFSGTLSASIDEHASASISGQVLVHDVDQDEAQFKAGFSALAPDAAKLADFSFDHQSGRWSLKLKPSTDLHLLKPGEQKTLLYRVRSLDDSQQEIAVIVRGEREAISGQLEQVVQEDLKLNTDGQLHSVLDFVPQTHSTHYGTFSLTADGHYRYALNNPRVQHLGAGKTLVDSFEVQLVDGSSECVRITLRGENDASSIDQHHLAVSREPQTASLRLGVRDVDFNEHQMKNHDYWLRGRYGVYRVQGIDTLEYRRLSDSALLRQEEILLESVDGTQHAVTVSIAPSLPVAPPPLQSQIELNEPSLLNGGHAVRSEVLTLPFGGEGAWRAQFSALPVGLRSNGQPLSWWLDDSKTLLVGSCSQQEVIRLVIDQTPEAAPVVHATLAAALDHQPGSDRLTSAIGLVLSSKQQTLPGVLNLRITDDQPLIEPTQVVGGKQSIDTNLMVLLDGSCHMRAHLVDRLWAAGPGETSRMALAKQLITELIDQYAEYGQVKLHFLLYDQATATGWDANGNTHQTTAWLSAQDALQMLNNGGLEQHWAGSLPNYDLALRQAASLLTPPEPLGGAQVQNKMLFISGIQPGQAPSEEALTVFQRFSDEHQIQVRTLGIGHQLDVCASGSSKTLGILQSIAFDGTGAGSQLMRHLTEADQLSAMLPDRTVEPAPLPIEGRLGQFGADGGSVCEIGFAGQVYRFDPQANTLNGAQLSHWHQSDSDWQWRFDPDNSSLQFRSSHHLVVLDLHNAKYRYTSQQAQPEHALQLDFKLVDGDGDQARGSLLMTAGGVEVSPMSEPTYSGVFHGASGADDFTWYPHTLRPSATDWVMDFDWAEGDRLDFSALFKDSRAGGANLPPRLTFEADNGNTKVLLMLEPDPSTISKTVVLKQVDLFADLHADSSAALLEKMLQQDLLVV